MTSDETQQAVAQFTLVLVLIGFVLICAKFGFAIALIWLATIAAVK